MTKPQIFLDGAVTLHHGDCLKVLKTLKANSFHSLVSDPPYHLTSIVKRFGKTGSKPSGAGYDGAHRRMSKGFMGKKWDGGDVAFQVETWKEVFRVLKPGAHLLAFSSTRNYHRMACAIEDAGFEIKDCVQWIFGSGFQKSHNVSKAINKKAGVEFEAEVASGVGFMGPDGPGGYSPTKNKMTQKGKNVAAADKWKGWGTSLKPACELICMARKPLSEKTIIENVLKHGTGAINIDACRIKTDEMFNAPQSDPSKRRGVVGKALQATGGAERNKAAQRASIERTTTLGRIPANVIHDGSNEVVRAFPRVGNSHAPANEGSIRKNHVYGADNKPRTFHDGFLDSGSAARFFYSPKADVDDRLGSHHPTVKPLDLIQYLVRLITPLGGTVLDLFAGTGTTGEAAWREGFKAVLIELEAEYVKDIRKRMSLAKLDKIERKLSAKNPNRAIQGTLF